MSRKHTQAQPANTPRLIDVRKFQTRASDVRYKYWKICKLILLMTFTRAGGFHENYFVFHQNFIKQKIKCLLLWFQKLLLLEVYSYLLHSSVHIKTMITIIRYHELVENKSKPFGWSANEIVKMVQKWVHDRNISKWISEQFLSNKNKMTINSIEIINHYRQKCLQRALNYTKTIETNFPLCTSNDRNEKLLFVHCQVIPSTVIKSIVYFK